MGKLEAVIEPHYPKVNPTGGGRWPYPLSVMLRIYFLQQWYQLSDPGADEALYDIRSMRTFAGLELGRDAIPEETTILNFRHLLERHNLTKAVFESVAEQSAGARRNAARRHDHGCHADCGLALDEEQGGPPRSLGEPVEEGQSVVFWDEGPHRRRRQKRLGPHRRRDDGQGSRRQGDGQSDLRG